MNTSTEISLFVEGTPVAWSVSGGGHPRAKSEKLVAWQNKIAKEALLYVGAGFDRIIETVELHLCFYMPRSQNAVKCGATYPHRPDLSNLVKAAEDALKGVVIEDDSQVVRIVARKEYVGREAGSAGVAVSIKKGEL